MPDDKFPEFAFIGRSNVGKSSLINMLLDKKSLAKTSGSPGKTQMINRFEVNNKWFLVDLPGYGYAKLSKKHRGSLKKMIFSYLIKRQQLLNTFVLIDIRHKFQRIDKDFLIWAGENQIPFSIVFTKSDKIKNNELNKNLSSIIKELKKYWNPLPPHFISSAVNKTGRNDILSYINELH
jgi:GTP-binding protein